MEKHYVVIRREHGFGTGPGSGVQYPDSLEVMAASRTEEGAKKAQRKLGGSVKKVDGPYRRYAQNEPM